MKRRRYIYILVFLLIFFFFQTFIVYAKAGEEYDETLDSVLESIDFSDIENFFDEYLSEAFDGTSFIDVLNKYISNEDVVDAGGFLNYYIKTNRDRFKSAISVFVAVFCIAVLSSVFKSTADTGTKDIIFLVCNISSSVLIFAECSVVIADSFSFLSDINTKMQGVLPLFTTLSTISGYSVKARALTPVCALVTQAVAFLLKYLLMPLAVIVFVLASLGFVQDGQSLSKTRDFLSSVIKWGLGICATVFSLYLTISGIGGAVKDGVALRTLKYSVGGSIPVVGSFAKESVELIITAGTAVKSYAGTLFLVILSLTFLKPLLMLLFFSLALKLLRIFISPFGAIGFYDLIDGFQGAFSLVIAIVVAIFVIFIFVSHCLLFLGVGA